LWQAEKGKREEEGRENKGNNFLNLIKVLLRPGARYRNFNEFRFSQNLS
jgi:hypothetical protein